MNILKHTLEALVALSITYKSLANLTGVSVDPTNDVVDISPGPDFDSTNLFELKNSLGITYDPTSGGFFAVTGKDSGKQSLYEVCGDSSIPIATVSPDDVVLTCMTSGPNGVFALDILTLDYGKLNTKTGAWNRIGNLPEPYDAYVFAQDPNGLLHYINGDGNYYTSRGNNKKMKQVDGVTFPSGLLGFCGEFEGDSSNTIIAANSAEEGLIRYNIDDASAKQKDLSPATTLFDVTNGPLSKVCPARKLIGLSNAPKQSIVNINPISFATKSKMLLKNSPGITQNAASGTLYAIKGFNRGGQKLIRVCASETIDVAPISSPFSAELSCLTSGPSGLYSLDLKSKGFGKLNPQSGRFIRVGDLPGPYATYAFAQDLKGNLHYINGDGIHYKSKTNGNTEFKATGIVFTTKLIGSCGEFDGSDIIAASSDVKGGLVRYSLLTSTATRQKGDSTIYYVDVTTGPYSDDCPADELTAVSLNFEVVTINPTTTAISSEYKLNTVKRNMGITQNSKTGEIYAIQGTKAGEQKLMQLCGDSNEPIANISPNNVVLKCMTHGPNGVYVIELPEPRYGKVNMKTGKYTRVGSLRGELSDTYVFAQDSEGVLHYINGEGKYYTNRKDENIFRYEAGMRFSTDINAVCGDFDGEDIVAAANLEKKGGTVRYSFSTMSSNLQSYSPNTFFNDVTAASLSDTDDADVCSSSKSSKSKGSTTEKNSSKKSSKKGSKKSSKKGSSRSKKGSSNVMVDEGHRNREEDALKEESITEEDAPKEELKVEEDITEESITEDDSIED